MGPEESSTTATLAVPSRMARTLAACAVLSLLASLLFALTSGEFVTNFHKACLHRYTDIDGFAYHLTEGTGDQTHPAYAPFIRYNKSAPLVLARVLMAAGLALPTAVNLVVLLMRTAFCTGISWLVLAATGKRSLALLGVILACCLPSNAHIYGHLFHPALTGYFTTSVFLLACSLCLLGYRRVSLVCWLLQLWVHPTTFVCWSPVFVGLYLIPFISRRPSMARYGRPYLALLVVGPLLAGLAAGLAEKANLLPFAGGADYWALVRAKSCHSVFLFSANYALPLQYASQVAALFILAFSARGRDCPLRPLNVLSAFAGLGIGVMWAGTVETEFSVAANMCLPLRFECVMYPLIVANVLWSIFCPSRERSRESTLAAGYGALLLFPPLSPLLWAWAWALGQAWLQSDGRRRHVFVAGAATGILLVCGYLALGPSGRPLEWSFRQLALPLEAAGMLAIMFAASLWIKLTWRRLAYVAACAACLLITPRTWITNPAVLISEVKSILGRQPESSAQKQACDWINAHIAPGTPVLVSQSLYLHRLTHVRTSVNKDIIEYFLYAPSLAEPLVAEMEAIYGIDLREMARRHQRLNLTWEDWSHARAAALRPLGVDEHTWRYVIEPAHVEPADGCAVVFANSYVRIYETDVSSRSASGSTRNSVSGVAAFP